jgi:hypothetical protein
MYESGAPALSYYYLPKLSPTHNQPHTIDTTRLPVRIVRFDSARKKTVVTDLQEGFAITLSMSELFFASPYCT